MWGYVCLFSLWIHFQSPLSKLFWALKLENYQYCLLMCLWCLWGEFSACFFLIAMVSKTTKEVLTSYSARDPACGWLPSLLTIAASPDSCDFCTSATIAFSLVNCKLYIEVFETYEKWTVKLAYPQNVISCPLFYCIHFFFWFGSKF